MNDFMTIAKRDRENKKLFTMKNADKTTMAEVAKVSCVIDLKSKHSWPI